VVEEAALRLSIADGGEQWEEGIVLAFHRLSKVGASGGRFVLTPEWSQAHQEFHYNLLAACGNEWLLGFCRKLYEQSTRYRARRRLLSAGTASPELRNIVKAHRSIMDATLARDADQAAGLLVQHYRLSFELVTGAKYELLAEPHRLVPSAPGRPTRPSR
jgi:GntR family transcriptional regulator, carbon starvation induced regulator